MAEHDCVSAWVCDAKVIRDMMQDTFHELFLALMACEALPHRRRVKHYFRRHSAYISHIPRSLSRTHGLRSDAWRNEQMRIVHSCVPPKIDVRPEHCRQSRLPVVLVG